VISVANLEAALRKYGRVNCRHCDAKSATAEISRDPFADGYRMVYRCHGAMDFRVIDMRDLLTRDLGKLFAFLVSPIFDRLMPFTNGAAYPKLSAGARMQRRMRL
jgi:hypothetical protein